MRMFDKSPPRVITEANVPGVDPGHSAYDRPRTPRDGDQRSELMSITIPRWVRVLDGVTDPLGGYRRNVLKAHNGINQIAEIGIRMVGSPVWIRTSLGV